MPINLVSLIPEPFQAQLLFISQTIEKAGYECFLVGGAVRDLYMGLKPNEYDLTTSAKPEIIKSLFKTVIETGIKHGTVTVVLDKTPYEITTYRIDKDYKDGRRPETVEFGASLSEDLKRRDFTMNALAMDLVTGDIIDEHKGCGDIDHCMIRTIGSPLARFSEDGLRPIRAMRFASVLNFEIESETRQAISQTSQVTAKVSVERFQDEIIKSFFGRRPSKMLQLLLEEKTLVLFLPELEAVNLEHLNQKYFKVLDELPKDNLGFILGVWAFLLMPTCPLASWEKMLFRLKFSNTMTRDALYLISFLQNAETLTLPLSAFQIRKAVLSPLKKHSLTRKITPTQIWKCLELLAPHWYEQARNIWDQNPPLLLSDLEMNGKQLETSFPTLEKQKYGAVLHFLLEQVWEHPENNQFASLTRHAADYLSKMS